MTSELRPAVEVATEVATALTKKPANDRNLGEYLAAAVIEADREAVRAEQAAEVERLTLTVRKLQGHQAALESYLREIRDKPVVRSSDAWKRHCLKLQAIAAEALGDVA